MQLLNNSGHGSIGGNVYSDGNRGNQQTDDVFDAGDRRFPSGAHAAKTDILCARNNGNEQSPKCFHDAGFGHTLCSRQLCHLQALLRAEQQLAMGNFGNAVTGHIGGYQALVVKIYEFIAPIFLTGFRVVC